MHTIMLTSCAIQAAQTCKCHVHLSCMTVLSLAHAGSPQAPARSLAASSASIMRSASSAALTASAAAVGAPVVLVRSAANLVMEPKQALAAALSWAYWQPIPLQVRCCPKADREALLEPSSALNVVGPKIVGEIFTRVWFRVFRLFPKQRNFWKRTIQRCDAKRTLFANNAGRRQVPSIADLL